MAPATSKSQNTVLSRLLYFVAVCDRLHKTSHYTQFQAKLAGGVNLHQAVALVGQAYGKPATAQAQAFINKIPFLDLDQMEIAHEKLVQICDPTAIQGFQYAAVDVIDKVVVVVCDRPLDPSFKALIKKQLGDKYTPVIATASDTQIANLIAKARMVQKTTLGTLGASVRVHETVLQAAEKYAILEESLTEEDIFKRFEGVDAKDSAKASDLVRALLIQAYKQGASDVHIEPGQDVRGIFKVRYRIDGKLVDRGAQSMQLYPQVSTGIKQMSLGMDLSLRDVPQDGRIKLSVRVAGQQGYADATQLDIRVGCIPQGSGSQTYEKFVFRILDGGKSLPTLVELIPYEDRLKMMTRVLDLPNGLVLMTGPTGSGKTTTLARFITEVNKPHYSIYSVEDPIEYVIPGVTQTQVKEERGLTFASILRSHLRLDPDIILVGEIRDNETAAIVIKAALTGHQVFSTLHTLDAVGAIPRLIDMGIEHYLLADALSYVGAQRLVQKICPDCMQPEPISQEVRDQLPEAYRNAEFFRGSGCASCRGTGYRGRVTVIEHLLVDPQVRRMIAEKSPLQEIRKYNQAHYSGSLFDEAVAVAAYKRTTLQEAFLLKADMTE
jgi:type II secretory ATPase GspE/PulE/Tfp pilus assembly ATPase PilB-like protein